MKLSEKLDRIDISPEVNRWMKEYANNARLLEAIAEAAELRPDFGELLKMGRGVRMHMEYWDDFGHFRTGLEHQIYHWRLRMIEAAIAATREAGLLRC